jgi:hypothetical protein
MGTNERHTVTQAERALKKRKRAKLRGLAAQHNIVLHEDVIVAKYPDGSFAYLAWDGEFWKEVSL